MARIHFPYTGKVASWLIRAVAATLKVEIVDESGILLAEKRPPMIWSFWHNRMFLIPWFYEQHGPGKLGCILSSPSGDGQIIADACAEFGLQAVRGSSSRKGLSALIMLAEKVRTGYDVGITPDGPRGPCYTLNPGPLKLAQLTGALITPVHVTYEHWWAFKTWDRFRIPRPFSRARIIFSTPMAIERRLTDEQFEQRRQEVEAVMRSQLDDLA